MITQISASALPEFLKGEIWYQNVYNQSQACPG